MKEIVNASEAARIIGCEPAVVRFYLSKRIWTFGRVISQNATGGKLKKYLINTREMCTHFGIPLEEAERRVNGGGKA